jgi:hypothetical protein
MALNMFTTQVFLLIEGQDITKSIHSFTQQMLKVPGFQHSCHLGCNVTKGNKQCDISFLLE